MGHSPPNPSHEDPLAGLPSRRLAVRPGSLLGRTVRLRSEVVTRGGAVLAKGSLMTVTEHRGKRLVLLKRDVCAHCQCGHQYLVRGVSEVTVEVLP